MIPHATNHPISYFYKYHQGKALDLSPQFQRKAVWTDEQASYLIDTILNELPFPEVYVRSRTDESGETTLEVVDGQQRLRSIILFYTNRLVLGGENVTEQWRGTSWSKLSKEKREEFWAYKIVVRELEGASDAEVRDMFRRLNANQSNLNAQELRHSQFKGEFIQTVEQIADDPWWLENRIVTPTQVRRMLDVEYITELLIGMIAGPLDKKVGLDDYYVDYEEEFPDREPWTDLFKTTRDLTVKLVGGNLRGWTSKTEYYSLFLAVGRVVYDEEIPKGKALSRAISRLSTFRARADQAKRRDNKENFAGYVHDYVDAVSRASTDLARRERRIDIVYSLIRGVRP